LRLISINLENIAGHLRRAKSGKRIERCGISTFQIAQSLATVASFAIGNTASGENDREWSQGVSVQHTGVSISDGALREAVAVCLSFGAGGTDTFSVRL